MDQEYINQITLQYLFNPNLIVNTEIDTSALQKDIKFYRKRINQITKDMSKGTFLDNNLKNIFHNYVSEIIHYFKQQDLREIYQREYSDLSFNNENVDENIHENVDENIHENIDELLTIPSNPITLNNFVKKININSGPEIIPIKKDINIKDPIFRKKGLKKE